MPTFVGKSDLKANLSQKLGLFLCNWPFPEVHCSTFKVFSACTVLYVDQVSAKERQGGLEAWFPHGSTLILPSEVERVQVKQHTCLGPLCRAHRNTTLEQLKTSLFRFG